MTKKLKCVMLIDDDSDDNFFHQIILREANIAEQIKITSSGFEALEYLTKAPEIPELIFLDINMPKMNGWEFLEEYSRLNILQNTVIVMLTTSLNPADEERAKKINKITGFKTKPLTANMLNDILSDYF